MHNARFMADSIYLHGYVLHCAHDGPTLSQSSAQDECFVPICYGPNFLKCGLASTAPVNGLEYFYYMLELSEVSVVFVNRYRYSVRVGSSKEGLK